MNPMNQLPQEPLAPTRTPIAKAISSAFEQVNSEQAQREEPSVYLAHGVGRPITTPLERAMADIQAASAIAKEILDKTIEENNYSKETAAAISYDSFLRIESVAGMYAELVGRSPGAAILFRERVLSILEKMTPGESLEGPKNYLVNSA